MIKAKAYICIFSGIAGMPTLALCTLVQSNFWLSIVMIALEYLVAENWIAPAMAMILNTVSTKNKGFAVSAFLFITTIAGTIATLLLNYLILSFNAKENP